MIPRILALRSQWKRSEKEWKRLEEAGVSEHVINVAISSFIVQVCLSFYYVNFTALCFKKFKKENLT